jgi:uncharacterized protein (TIGR02145 family)
MVLTITDFSALPSGYRLSSVGRFYGAGNYGHWWTATDNGGGSAYYRFMDRNSNHVYKGYYYDGGGRAVRCVQDSK